MQWYQLLAVIPILFGSAIIQSAVGFSFALFAVPMLLLAGLTPIQAMTISVVATTAQCVQAIYELRREIDWRKLVPMIAVATVFMIGGVSILKSLSTHYNKETVAQVIAVVMLALVIIRWLWHVEPRPHLGRGWDFLAAGCSGVLSGFAAIGGPPMVLWVHAHDWSSRKIRGMLFGFFGAKAPITLTLYWLSFREPVVDTAITALPFIPIVLIGSLIGMRIGNRISRPRLMQVTYLILIALSLYTMVTPLLKSSSSTTAPATASQMVTPSSSVKGQS